MGDAAIVTEWMDLAIGDAMLTAYLARPAAPGDYPGIVVGHEIYGQHASAVAATDRLAALGAIAILPDLFHRVAPRAELEFTADRDRGLELLRTLRRPEVLADISACLAELRRRGATSSSMVGFSAGGHVAYYAATQLPLAATAAVYPGWLTDTGIPLSTPEPTVEYTPGITGRMLLLFGGDDPLIPAAARESLANTLRANDIDHEIVVYDDAPHGFLFPGRPSYREDIAEDAWKRLADLVRP
ncbi:dienelactone hydrolase family protein [Nocardia sp. IFM 10818]